jgi:hypothetical protein
MFESLSLPTDLSKSPIRILDYCGDALALYVLIENGSDGVPLPSHSLCLEEFPIKTSDNTSGMCQVQTAFVEERSDR